MYKKFICVTIFISLNLSVFGQSFSQGDIILNGNIGVPHLFKNIVKIAANSERFKENFEGVLEITAIKGINPVAVKAEYGFTKYFGLGLSWAFWNINFDVKDYYNVQNQSFGTFLKDSLDVYNLNISSKSFGIRPNLHIPIGSRSNDLYIGCALGLTKNKLTIDFSSTDAGRTAKKFDKDLEYDLSLPGGIYFGPSIGYRHFFGEYAGFNVEFGYEKGAVLQAGVVFRIKTGN